MCRRNARSDEETSNGRTFRVVGHLPIGLRYPAVTSTANALVIAGGVSSAGPVSTVYRFDATTRRVRVLAHLPVRSAMRVRSHSEKRCTSPAAAIGMIGP